MDTYLNNHAQPEPVLIGEIDGETVQFFPIADQKPKRKRKEWVYKSEYDGQVLGEGYLTSVNIENPLDVSVRDSFGYMEYFDPRRIDITAQLYNFHL